MPELPEVETIRRDLTGYLVGLKIIHVALGESRVIRGDHRHIEKAVTGTIVQSVDRVGKLLIVALSNDQHLLFHLKMTGQLFFKKIKGEITRGGHSLSETIDATMPNKHTRAVFTFDDQSKLFFNDMRLFGFLQLVDLKQRSAIVERYGIEPLTENFTLGRFISVFRGRKTNVKALLLNQSLIAGIGNIYADEICFAARVLPQRGASTLTEKEMKALLHSSEKIIANAIEKRGTTFNSYIDGQGRKGNYSQELRVYGRGGEACVCCGTTLKKIKVAGRGTVYCPSCQR